LQCNPARDILGLIKTEKDYIPEELYSQELEESEEFSWDMNWEGEG
jgi:hypothetical protein